MKNHEKVKAKVDEEKDVSDEAAGSGPDEGPTMSVAGAMPSGSQMAHWNTSQAPADATEPGTMPKTKSKPAGSFPG